MQFPVRNGKVEVVSKEDLVLKKKEEKSDLYKLNKVFEGTSEEEIDEQFRKRLEEKNSDISSHGEEEVEYQSTIKEELDEEELIGEVELQLKADLLPKIQPLDYSELSEDERNLLLETDEHLRVSDVILSNLNKKRINDFLREREYAEELIDAGLVPMNRLLMYGASGTGKTMLTRALANEIGYNMLAVNIAEALGKGNAADNIHKIFRIAREHDYCMIYLDECDSIAWNRADDSRGEDPNLRRALTSVFQCMDRMDDSKTVICASTNLLTNLDPAFERRFHMKMEFRRPQLNLKDDIRKFVRKYPKFKIVDNVDSTLERVVQYRTSMSYYELEVLINSGLKRAVIDGTYAVSLKDIFVDIANHMRIKIDLNTFEENEKVYERPVEKEASFSSSLDSNG